jgi:hypothetical protein
VRLPPRKARFRPNPVSPLTIIRDGAGIGRQLSVPEPPGKGVVVLFLGARACNAGRSSTIPYSITKLYTEKFDLPSPGQRVFIRTRQLIVGWEDEPKETNAPLPNRAYTQPPSPMKGLCDGITRKRNRGSQDVRWSGVLSRLVRSRSDPKLGRGTTPCPRNKRPGSGQRLMEISGDFRLESFRLAASQASQTSTLKSQLRRARELSMR